jgi:hypothetical protein
MITFINCCVDSIIIIIKFPNRFQDRRSEGCVLDNDYQLIRTRRARKLNILDLYRLQHLIHPQQLCMRVQPSLTRL